MKIEAQKNPHAVDDDGHTAVGYGNLWRKVAKLPEGNPPSLPGRNLKITVRRPKGKDTSASNPIHKAVIFQIYHVDAKTGMGPVYLDRKFRDCRDRTNKTATYRTYGEAFAAACRLLHCSVPSHPSGRAPWNVLEKWKPPLAVNLQHMSSAVEDIVAEAKAVPISLVGGDIMDAEATLPHDDEPARDLEAMIVPGDCTVFDEAPKRMTTPQTDPFTEYAEELQATLPVPPDGRESAKRLVLMEKVRAVTLAITKRLRPGVSETLVGPYDLDPTSVQIVISWADSHHWSCSYTDKMFRLIPILENDSDKANVKTHSTDVG